MKTPGLSLLMIALSALAPSAARATPLPNPPKTPDPALVGFSDYLTMLFSNFSSLSRKKYAEHERTYTLPDGTKIGGLLFNDPSRGPRPLIIACFGLLTDRWSRSSSSFVHEIIEENRLDANVLIVDHPTSGPFMAMNDGEISLGGYEGGRILVELGKLLRDKTSAQAAELQVTSMHLLGVSLAGNDTLHAMLEDQRLGGGTFVSAITFNAMVHETRSTSTFMDAFGHPLDSSRLDSFKPRRLPGQVQKAFAGFVSRQARLAHEFGYDALLSVQPKRAAPAYYDAFLKRLSRLAAPQPGAAPLDWDPAIDRASFEGYFKTSRASLSGLKDLKAPLIMIHSHDDPVIPYEDFKQFAQEQAQSPEVFTWAVRRGGHWGFEATYGVEWEVELIQRALAVSPAGQLTLKPSANE